MNHHLYLSFICKGTRVYIIKPCLSLRDVQAIFHQYSGMILDVNILYSDDLESWVNNDSLHGVELDLSEKILPSFQFAQMQKIHAKSLSRSCESRFFLFQCIYEYVSLTSPNLFGHRRIIEVTSLSRASCLNVAYAEMASSANLNCEINFFNTDFNFMGSTRLLSIAAIAPVGTELFNCHAILFDKRVPFESTTLPPLSKRLQRRLFEEIQLVNINRMNNGLSFLR